MRLTIANKLGLGFGSILILMVLSSLWVYLAVDRMNVSSERMTARYVPVLRANDDLLIALNRSVGAMRGFILLGRNPREANFFESELAEAQRASSDAIATLDALYAEADDIGDRDFQKLQDRLSDLHAAQLNVLTAAKQELSGTAPADASGSAATGLMESTTVPLTRELRSIAESLRDVAGQRVTDERNHLQQARTAATNTLLFATSTAMLLGIIVAVLLSRRIVNAVHGLLGNVQLIARGDLSITPPHVSSSDEIGDLAEGFRQMVFALRDVLGEARVTSNDVAAASSEISTGAQQQLTSLNETATSLNEITTTAEEFKATMQEFADRAKAVHEAAAETARRAAEGRAFTQESAERIEQVRINAHAAGESVVHLAEEMLRIGEITASVNEIAEQTKLLALNASIEAARAGDDGRGFSVVAMQVRELANQSKDAAGRIEQLITKTQKSMQAVVSKIEAGGRLSEDSTSTVRRVSTAFEEIVRAIEQIREAIAQINTGARQQEAGISELVSSITEIDSASKESVAAAEQTQRSIVAIDERIQSLNVSISRFRT